MQEQLARLELAVGGARHAVVHDRAVRAGAGDGVEGNVAQRHLRFGAGRRRNSSSRVTAAISSSEPGAWRSSQAQHLRHRRAVAAVRGARAGDLGLVLGGARQAGRVGELPPPCRRWPRHACADARRRAPGRARSSRRRRQAAPARHRAAPAGGGRRAASDRPSVSMRQLALVDEQQMRSVRRRGWRRPAPAACAARRCRGC